MMARKSDERLGKITPVCLTKAFRTKLRLSSSKQKKEKKSNSELDECVANICMCQIITLICLEGSLELSGSGSTVH